jgi:hypothetical protein
MFNEIFFVSQITAFYLDGDVDGRGLLEKHSCFILRCPGVQISVRRPTILSESSKWFGISNNNTIDLFQIVPIPYSAIIQSFDIIVV